jgi:RNA polymerase sigma-70 factor (ECF subfamily)
MFAVLSGGERSAADRELIEELYSKYAGLIFVKCTRILGDKEDAADAVQETFIKAFRSLHTFRYGETHLPWLYQVATTVCLNQLRTRKRKGTMLLEEVNNLVSSDPMPLEAIFVQRLWEDLQTSCDRRTLEIFCAYHIDGMDQGQIAQQLKMSRRAVVKRLARFRETAQRLHRKGSSDG